MKNTASQRTGARFEASSEHERAMRRLEDEMKLLHWHKLANETAIQTALMRTKVIREEEAKVKPILEHSKRMYRKARLDRVRKEAESKPLELHREIKIRYEDENRRRVEAHNERSERRDRQRLRIQQKVAEHQELKSRREKCRLAMPILVENCCNGRTEQKTKINNNLEEAKFIDCKTRSAEKELEQVLRKLENNISK